MTGVVCTGLAQLGKHDNRLDGEMLADAAVRLREPGVDESVIAQVRD